MLLCDVGVLKTVQCTAVWQQWLVAGWLGPSVTVIELQLGLGPGNCVILFFFFFFFSSLSISDLNTDILGYPGLFCDI